MRVNEIFYSIDGEGLRAGALAVFIRLAGCNLRCSYCDTSYAWEEDAGQDMTIREILEYIERYGCDRITLTGGEPLRSREGMDLTRALVEEGYEVNIETNGSVAVEDVLIPGTIITMDYKCPSSGCESSMLIDNIGILRKSDALKFVVGTEEDLHKAAEIIEKYNPACQCFLSPVFGGIEPAEIVEFMKDKDMHRCRLQLQMHKYIWGPEEKGV